MSRPLPPQEPAERARHGGTTRPSQESVWDLRVEAAAESVIESATESVTDRSVVAVIDAPADALVDVAAPEATHVTPAASPVEEPRNGRLATLLIAGCAVLVVAAGWFLIAARTSDAGSMTTAPPAHGADLPTIAEIAEQNGAAGAAELFVAGPAATVPAPAVPAPSVAAPSVPAPAVTPSTAPAVPPRPTGTVPPPTTTAPVPASTAPPPASVGPTVEIVARTEPCKFGASCLVAGYVLHGFDVAPREFVCEFASGNRFTFGAGRLSVERACATGTPGDSITIEVAGVRSETVTHG